MTEDLYDKGKINITPLDYALMISSTTMEQEYNLLSEEDKQLAAAVVNARLADPLIYARLTYNASYEVNIPSLYYRSVSAKALNLPFLEFDNTAKNRRDRTEESQALQFINGFFTNDAGSRAIPYIRALERDLSPDELRAAAKAFEEEEMYLQSMRLISLYINKEDYKRERSDFELMFPRPYLELNEKWSRQFNIEPSLFFGLIRTESAFQSAVVSRAGATGLAQLMPATAQDMAGRMRRSAGVDYTGNLDLSDPSLNVHIGAYYYNYLLGLFDNNDIFSLMAYNGGLGRVRRWRNANSQLPADLVMETVNIYETRDYGKRVLGYAAVYQLLYY